MVEQVLLLRQVAVVVQTGLGEALQAIMEVRGVQENQTQFLAHL
jgi:hypothetical protein